MGALPKRKISKGRRDRRRRPDGDNVKVQAKSKVKHKRVKGLSDALQRALKKITG